MIKHKQSGFTLIEIAIVLVIIGLLLGGVLKGQEMIANAKIKRVASDFDGVTAAIYTYQDRYRALPGDDTQALVRWGAGISVGNGNGLIAGNWNSATNTDESRIFWQHLRNSNLIPGTSTGATSFAQPVNSFGGNIGLMNTNYGLAGLTICMSGIDGPNANIIDTQLDDGNPATGTVRSSTTAVAATGDANYSSTTLLYNVCRKL